MSRIYTDLASDTRVARSRQDTKKVTIHEHASPLHKVCRPVGGLGILARSCWVALHATGFRRNEGEHTGELAN